MELSEEDVKRAKEAIDVLSSLTKSSEPVWNTVSVKSKGSSACLKSISKSSFYLIFIQKIDL